MPEISRALCVGSFSRAYDLLVQLGRRRATSPATSTPEEFAWLALAELQAAK